jgi:hypothetical protein
MADPCRVVVADAHRAERNDLVHIGGAPARMITRARILLKADHGEAGPGWSDDAMVGARDVHASTVLRVRRPVATEGLSARLERTRPDRIDERTMDGEQEARLMAIACSEAPDGADHWALRLVAEEVVRLEVVPAISSETVRRTLEKTR